MRTGVCGFCGEESAGDGFEDEAGWAMSSSISSLAIEINAMFCPIN
jgi:phosphoglucomutase